MNYTNQNPVFLRDYDGIVTFSNHNHPGGTPFDAVDVPSKYCKAAAKAGYKKFAVTDHGSFSSTQHCIDYVKKEKLDLEIVYGLEAYVEVPDMEELEKIVDALAYLEKPRQPYDSDKMVSHVIFLAKDDEGKHIIDKMNSYAGALKKDTPIITWEQLKAIKFDGHVVATSACIQGAPDVWLWINHKIDKEIEGIKKSLESAGAISPTDKRVAEANDAIAKEVEELAIMKTRSNSKYYETIIREANKVARDCKKLKLDKELEEAVAKAKNAADELKKLKEDISAKEKLIKKLKTDYAPLFKSVEKYEADSWKIQKYEKMRQADGGIAMAKRMLSEFREMLGEGNYYVEVQYHGLELEKLVYPTMAKLARELNIPLVAANDAHMPDNSSKSINMRRVAKFLRFSKIMEEDETDEEYYVKTPNELARALAEILSPDEIDEAMMNLNRISEQCTWKPTIASHAPKFGKDIDSAELLKEKVNAGIKKKFSDDEFNDTYKARIEYELSVIISMGFADYFLIVQDFIEYARIVGYVPIKKMPEVPLTIEGALKYVKEHGYKVGIGVGKGRGSGAGSLVAHVLDITDLDPIKYNLLFERFLNPERVTMPDIDTDLALGVKDKATDYVRAKYGEKAVVGILTETKEGTKGAVQDCARYWSCKMTNNEDKTKFLALGAAINKLVPKDVNVSFNSKVGDTENTVYDVLVSTYSGNDDALAILSLAKDCEGMLRGYGQHAAAVIIYDGDDITDYAPVKPLKDGGAKTEMNMIQCEEAKLLKMDFLGLRTLTIISNTAQLIEQHTGEVIDVSKISPTAPDSERVYNNIYRKGRTKSVFQFESPGIRGFLKQMLND